MLRQAQGRMEIRVELAASYYSLLGKVTDPFLHLTFLCSIYFSGRPRFELVANC